MQYLYHIGSTQTHGGNIQTTALAYDRFGRYLGVWCGKAIIPCDVPRSFVRAGGADWQAVTATGSGVLLFSWSFPARDAVSAWRNFDAMKAQSQEART